MYAILGEESGSWWYRDVEGVDSSEHAGENPESDVMVLAGLLPFSPGDVYENEPNTRLKNSGLDCCARVRPLMK